MSETARHTTPRLGHTLRRQELTFNKYYVSLMTNEQAIQIVLENKDPSNAERLAAMYACDDILEADIDVWLSKDVSEYLPQFPDIADSLVEDLLKEDSISVERVANSLTEVSRSMYHYVRFYETLSSYDIALSER
jgi:hypothetical protein